MSVVLLRLDNSTIINPAYIVQITVLNLNKLLQERKQHHQTAEQRARMDDLFWEVSVYLQNGQDHQRYTKRFKTELEAQNWIVQKFGTVN